MAADEARKALVSWLRSRGGHVNPKLDLFHELPNGDRGVVAQEDIAAGEELCLVPVACTLHIPTAAEISEASQGDGESFPPAALHLSGSVPDKTSPFIATVLLLMAEVARGDQSPWNAYIRSLPQSCDCLLSWSDDDKAMLKGCSIEDLTGGAATESAFNKEVAPQVKGHPELWPASHQSFTEFCRVAGLVQSRAFHMVAENWVTGTKQEGNDIFLIPGIDMINHSSDADRRNASLAKINTTLSIDVDGRSVEFTGFFTMKAEKPIAKGQQVLHTYGDLSDSQLLQTYGFIDLGSERPQTQPAAAERETGASSGRRRGGVGSRPAEPWVNPFNHALVPMSVLMAASQTALKDAMGAEVEGDEVESLESAKVAFLQEAQLLQPAAPADTHFVTTVAKPLPEELLTVMQVLMMVREEFDQLVAEYRETGGTTAAGSSGEAAKAGKAGAAGAAANASDSGAVPMCGMAAGTGTAEAGGAGAGASVSGRSPLVLGEDLLGEDIEFAELVSLTLIQVVDACMKRFPSNMKKDAQQLAQVQQQLASGSATAAGGDADAQTAGKKNKKKRKVSTGAGQDSTAASGSDPAQSTRALQRKMLALKVRLGEQEVLQRLKREAVMLVFRLQAAAAARAEAEGRTLDDDEDEDEDEDEDSDEGEDGEGEGEGGVSTDQTDDSDKVGYAE